MIEILRKITEPIKTWWNILPLTGEDYSYTIVDVDIVKQNSKIKAIIYFRALGSRAIEHANAQILNSTEKLRYFKTEHIQLIVTLATLESAMGKNNVDLQQEYDEFIKLSLIHI